MNRNIPKVPFSFAASCTCSNTRHGTEALVDHIRMAHHIEENMQGENCYELGRLNWMIILKLNDDYI